MFDRHYVNAIVFGCIVALGVFVATLLDATWRIYFAIFAVASIGFALWNPRRRFYRAGVTSLCLLAGPKLLSFSSVHFFSPFFGTFEMLGSEPGAFFYVSTSAVCILCLVLDYRTESGSVADAFFRTAFDKCRQVAVGFGISQTNTTINNFSPASEDIHAAITAASDRTAKGKPDVAIELLTGILSRVLPNDARARFRVHANLAFAHLELDESDLASQHFANAVNYEKETEDALALTAVAYFLQNDDAKAMEFAEATLNTYPSNARALSVFIQCAPETETVEKLEKQVPDLVRSNPEVLFALSRRAASEMKFETAEGYARRALRAAPESNRLKEHLATMILNSQSEVFRRSNVFAEPPPRAECVGEALAIFDELIVHAKHLTRPTLARVHHKIANCKWFLGDREGADMHFSTAQSLDGQASDTLMHRAQFLFQVGATDKAVAAIRQIPFVKLSANDQLLLATMLLSAKESPKEREAFDILKGGVSRLAELTSDARVQWLVLLCKASIATSNLAWFAEHIESLAELSQKPWIRGAFQAEIACHRDSCAEQRALLSEVVDSLTDGDVITQREWIADLCCRCKFYDLALRAWKPVAVASPNWPFWRDVLNCAVTCGDDSYIMEFCEGLRSNSCLDTTCLHAELDALARCHDDRKAIAVIQSFLPSLQNSEQEKVFRVRLAICATRSGATELLELDESQLPEVATVDETVGVWVVEVLRRNGLRERAVKYGYSLLRRFFDKPAVHQVYLAAFDLTMSDLRNDSQEIQIGDAVCYREENTDEEHWVIIEDLPEPNSLLGEFAPTSRLCINLIGRVAGAQFEVRRNGIQSRVGKIERFFSKYARRAVDTLESWETRFPEVPFVEKFLCKKRPDGSPDVSTIFQMIKMLSASRELVRQVYRANLLGISSFVKMMSLTHIEAAYILGSDKQTPIRCSFGHPAELARATKDLGTASTVVLDPSSATTLFVSGMYEVIEKLPARCLVTQSTLIAIREELLRSEHESPPSGYLAESSEGQDGQNIKEGYLARIRSFLDWLERNSEVRGGVAVTQLSKPQREQYEEVFPIAYLESACLAKAESAIHWTDDLTVAGVLDRDLGIQSVWTQAFFGVALENAELSADVYGKLVVRLLRFGFEATAWNTNIVLLAGNDCNWQMHARELASIIKSFESLGEDDAIKAAIEFCLVIESQTIKTSGMETFLLIVMQRLGARHQGRMILSGILKVLPEVFKTSYASEVSIRNIIKTAMIGIPKDRISL